MRFTSSQSQTPVALITGGGGRIAKALAEKLDRLGYRLVLTDVDEEAAKRTAATLNQAVRVIVCDQTSPEDCRRLIETVHREFPSLDVLVNNAGYINPGDFLEIPDSEIDRHCDINLTSPLRLIRGIAPLMKARGKGAIMNIVSVGGIVSLRGSALYSASKFGLRGFLNALHGELKPYGVKVSGIYPVAVDTPMLEAEARGNGSALNFINKVRTAEEVAEAVISGIRKGRMEIYVPYSDGLASRLAVLFPWIIPRIEPVLEWLGRIGRRRYLRKKEQAA